MRASSRCDSRDNETLPFVCQGAQRRWTRNFCDAESLAKRYGETYATIQSRAAKRGVSNGGGFPIWTCPSFFVLFCAFCPFWDFPDLSRIFPICSGMVRGFSRLVLFLFLGLLRAPMMRNSPERVRDTIWTFPKKCGKHPGWKPPGLASPKHKGTRPEISPLKSKIILSPPGTQLVAQGFAKSPISEIQGSRKI